MRVELRSPAFGTSLDVRVPQPVNSGNSLRQAGSGHYRPAGAAYQFSRQRSFGEYRRATPRRPPINFTGGVQLAEQRLPGQLPNELQGSR
jgi:hypothetical protein